MTAQTLFITGTDTGVGKTHVACALIRALAAEGLRVAGFKPVAAGAVQMSEGWVNEDALVLQAASNVLLEYHEVNPCLLREPVAPHIAAVQEGTRIEPATILAAHARLAARADVVIVEGAGGWLVPLNDDMTFADLVSAQGWPVLLVVGMRLGCLNHALLTARAVQQQGRLIGWVANPLPPLQSYIEANIDTLDKRMPAPRLLEWCAEGRFRSVKALDLALGLIPRCAE